MRIAVYSAKDFEISFLKEANGERHELVLIREALSGATTGLSNQCAVASIFAGDDASAPVLRLLAASGIQYIAIRAAGYDNVDLAIAKELGIQVANVPDYSPYAIAEHTVGMMLALNRKILLADSQVKEHNFTVGGLIGFDLHGKTVGLIGTGKIGSIVARILHGFGCKLLGYDLYEDESLKQELGIQYVDLNTLCSSSDIITIHTCLTDQTRHLINAENIALMKRGVMLINTARGAIIDTAAVLDALNNRKISALGIDVYERESGVFFYDKRGEDLNDPVLEQLMTMPNVLVTPHQAFATKEALTNIADTTIKNIDCWGNGERSPNELTV